MRVGISRLGDFWRGQARLGKVLTIVVIVVGALLIIGAISGRSNDDATSTPTTTATDTEAAAADPMSCSMTSACRMSRSGAATPGAGTTTPPST